MMKNPNLAPARALWALAAIAGAASCASAPPSTDAARSAADTREPVAMQPAVRPEARPVDAPSRVAAAPDVSRSPADRRGRFKVVRLEAKDPRNIKTRDSRLLEEVIRDMNETLGPKLPEDVSVAFAELGQANAFYTPSKRSIVVSYELLNEMIVLFLKNADRDDPKVAARVAQQVIDTLSFIVYHEVAHAMIDLCELPITGREEDAADQLATVMVVSSANVRQAATRKGNGVTQTAQGGQAAINGALYFLLSSRGSGQQSVEDLPFWDEHSLSEQRFYNILTWVYGSNPSKHASLVQNKILPESRAARAQNEFRRMTTSWLKILGDARAL